VTQDNLPQLIPLNLPAFLYILFQQSTNIIDILLQV